MRIADPRDVLLAPVISEKSYGLLDENKYTFIVAPDANKTQIKIAVEQVFGVRVTSVNTMNREGKRIRTRRGFGRRAATKRAIVSVAQGDRIEIRGFGSFSLHYRPPRMGRNPKTGESVALPGKHVPHFKPGKELRERVSSVEPKPEED